MHRRTRLVGAGATVVAAVLSIVSTVLALVRTGLTTHADQLGWSETTASTPTVDAAEVKGGASPWV